MNDTVKFAGNLQCLPQGGSTAYLLHAKQPAVPSSPKAGEHCSLTSGEEGKRTKGWMGCILMVKSFFEL